MTFRMIFAASVLMTALAAPAVAQTADKPSYDRCEAVGVILGDHVDLRKAQIAVTGASMGDPRSAADQRAMDIMQVRLDEMEKLRDDVWEFYFDPYGAADEDEIDWADGLDEPALMDVGRACLQ